MIGPLILGIHVTIGGWALPSSTFDEIASVFGDVHAKCLVHTLNRLFQDQGPILHDDNSNARFFRDEEDYCSVVLLATTFCRTGSVNHNLGLFRPDDAHVVLGSAEQAPFPG